MSVNINTVYEAVLLLSNRNQGGGIITADDFNRYANMVNKGMMNEDFEIFQKTQKLTDRIKSFIKKKQLYSPQSGQVAYPKDYFYFIAARTYKNDNYIKLKTECETAGTNPDYTKLPTISIKPIDNDKLGILNQSEVYQPSVQFPYLLFYNDYLQIYPIDLGVIILDYLEKPQDVLWAYTEVNELPVYNPATSINFQWDETVTNQIIMEICRYAGINTREFEVSKAVNELSALGV